MRQVDEHNPKTKRVPWPDTPEAAILWQEHLRRHLVVEDRLPHPLRLVGGVDAAYTADRAVAVIAVLTYPDFELIDYAVGRAPLRCPYIPGLLAMREGPAVEAAWRTLSGALRPDVLIFDGHGIAHPKSIGIAAHMGVLLNCPTIGVAKRLLVGHHEPVPHEAGSWQPLFYRGTAVGAVLRTRAGAKPVYVSPGHRLSVPTAVRLVWTTIRGYKLPEPVRLADRLARQAREQEEESHAHIRRDSPPR